MRPVPHLYWIQELLVPASLAFLLAQIGVLVQRGEQVLEHLHQDLRALAQVAAGLLLLLGLGRRCVVVRCLLLLLDGR